MDIANALYHARIDELETLLSRNSALANQGIALPDNPATAHPLHRLCDAVCFGLYDEAKALDLAKVLLRYGATLNGGQKPGKDSPLTAACSLQCDELALYYIEHGANIEHQGCHGGTALHWSAWCGRDKLVEHLAPLVNDINKLCIDFKSTPLFWAIHGLKFGSKENQYHQPECARILIHHGADKSIPNMEGYLPIQLLDAEDIELRNVLS